MISEAFPRMMRGVCSFSCRASRVRRESAPTATGSRTQGMFSRLASCTAVCMTAPCSCVTVPRLTSRAPVPPRSISTVSSASLSMAGTAPAASRRLAVRGCTTELVRERTSGAASLIFSKSEETALTRPDDEGMAFERMVLLPGVSGKGDSQASARAAASGSSAPQMAETAAIPAAVPVARTWRARSASRPPMATTGRGTGRPGRRSLPRPARAGR